MTSMRCGAIASNDGHSHRCGRNAVPGSVFCWQHRRNSQRLIADLQTHGIDSPDFLLHHLTLREKYVDESLFNIKATTTQRPLSLDSFQDGHDGISLGHLESLPLEVLWAIFAVLAFPDLTNFKAANSRAHEAVSTSAQYYCVSTYAPQLTAALYNRGLSSAFPISHIFETLTQAKCSACGRFAGYVLLPGLQRCCQRCAFYDKEFWPVDKPTAITKHGIPKESIEKLPKMLEWPKDTPGCHRNSWLYAASTHWPIPHERLSCYHTEREWIWHMQPTETYSLVSKAEARVRN